MLKGWKESLVVVGKNFHQLTAKISTLFILLVILGNGFKINA